MRAYTDYETVSYNEDGSWTTKSEITTYPPTKQEKILAATLMGAVIIAPLVPLGFFVLADKLEARREAKKAAKLKSV